jgi:Tfp pilus assembly protein PilO
MKLFIPTILVVAAIGLFVVYVNPTYQSTKDLSAQVDAYNTALDKSQELRQVRDQLLSKRNTFSPDDVTKLSDVLPDNVDNIRLIIDINNIASRHNLTLSNVQLGTIGGANSAAIGTASQGPVGNVDIGFSVNASYDNMLAFITDVEHSLRLIDIKTLQFTAGNTDLNSYQFGIRTYWLH